MELRTPNSSHKIKAKNKRNLQLRKHINQESRKENNIYILLPYFDHKLWSHVGVEGLKLKLGAKEIKKLGSGGSMRNGYKTKYT